VLSTKTKIGLLVTAHVACAIALTWADRDATWPSAAEIGQSAFVFADAGLLGIWGAFGTSRWFWRIPVILVGLVCLIASVIYDATGQLPQGIAMPLSIMIEAALVMSSPAWIILIVLMVLRCGRRRLHVTNSISSPAVAEGLQFTILHLFIATTAIAVALGLAPLVQKLAGTLMLLAVIGPCVVLVELAILWATLGIGRPWPRLVVVLPSAFVVGAVPPFYLSQLSQDWSTFVAWSAITGLQATITAGSLLVVRSCGWRLVGGNDEAVPKAD
jgi:hypothetical protein